VKHLTVLSGLAERGGGRDVLPVPAVKLVLGALNRFGRSLRFSVSGVEDGRGEGVQIALLGRVTEVSS